MTNKRGLTPDEAKIWKSVTRNVRALSPDKAEPKFVMDREAGPATKSKPASSKPEKTSAPASGQNTPAPARKGLADRRNEKRIRRGRTDTDLRLDLHGYTQDQAFRALSAFVVQCQHMGEKSALVITGKGRSGTGVLKSRFTDWLGSPEIRTYVSGYAPAHRKHGGDGAYYIFFRRQSD